MLSTFERIRWMNRNKGLNDLNTRATTNYHENTQMAKKEPRVVDRWEDIYEAGFLAGWRACIRECHKTDPDIVDLV